MANELIETGGNMPAISTDSGAVVAFDSGHSSVSGVSYGDEGGRAVEPLQVDASRAILEKTRGGQALIRSWNNKGSFGLNLGRVQRDVGKFIRDLGDDRERAAFMERFDREIPDFLRASIYDTVASCGAGRTLPPVSEADVQNFCRDTAAAALVREWGDDAAYKIARIWSKFSYLELVADDTQPLLDWFDRLADREARAVLEFAAQ